MRKLLVLLMFLFFKVIYPQSVHLDSKAIGLDTSKCEIVVWNLDWQNKIIHTSPTYIDFNEESSLSFYVGDYAVEYRIDDVVCLIYNIHVYPRGCYYRYSIYMRKQSKSIIRDRITINSTYMDF